MILTKVMAGSDCQAMLDSETLISIVKRYNGKNLFICKQNFKLHTNLRKITQICLMNIFYISILGIFLPIHIDLEISVLL